MSLGAVIPIVRLKNLQEIDMTAMANSSTAEVQDKSFEETFLPTATWSIKKRSMSCWAIAVVSV
jgi:hypothetical protein